MKSISWFGIVILVPFVILSRHVVVCFVPVVGKCRGKSSLNVAEVRRNEDEQQQQHSALLNEFRIASGELIDPYKVLKIDRDSTKEQIKQAYRKMSRKYHPDQIRYQTMMPGNCDTMEDVREEWERINLSYVILSDKRTRQRYDRNSNLADPGAAISRAAMKSVSWGLSNLAKGVFHVGSMAMETFSTHDNIHEEEENNNNETTNLPSP